MNHFVRKKLILGLAAALCIACLPEVTSASPMDSIDSSIRMLEAQSLGRVYISKNSFFEIKDAHLLSDTGPSTVTFTVSVHNGETSDLMFINYWVKLGTKSGSQFSVKTLPNDKDKNRIAPQTTENLHFYAYVNDSTHMSDLLFQFIKWDFNSYNYENNIGEIAVSDDFSEITPAGSGRLLQVGGIPVKTNVKKLLMNKNEQTYTPVVVMQLENAGSRNAVIPPYQFAIRTSEGYVYPLEAKGLNDLTINPRVNKELELTGSVPVSVSPDGWQLIVLDSVSIDNNAKINVPVGQYQLPSASISENVSLGKEYNFTDKAGVYNAKLNALYRLPWEDQDMVTAELALSNKGADSLPIPDLTGYFVLDGAVKVDAKLVKTEKVIGLSPQQSVSLQILGKIPYTNTFKTVKLVLQEKESPDKTVDLLEFSHSSELMAIPYIDKGDKYTTRSIGRQASYTPKAVNTYKGDSADVYSVSLQIENMEKRYSDVTKLNALLKAPDGSVFPAAIAEIKSKIGPKSRALLNIWSTLPKDYPTDGMRLIAGESVADNKLAEKEAKVDGYVNAVEYWLPSENVDVKQDLNNVTIFPYTFTFNKINTWLDREGVKLIFNYEVTKDLSAETNVDGHKLVLSVEDAKGSINFTKEYSLKDLEPQMGDATASSSASTSDKLKLGKEEGFKIAIKDPSLIFKLETLKTYSLKLYDQYQGQMKLLAVKKIDWFSTTD